MIFFVRFHLQLQVEGSPRDESQVEKFSGNSSMQHFRCGFFL